jgi:carboxypeptidase C (cathepsin A)
MGGNIWALENFTLLTTYMAGHMVPKDRQAACAYAVDSFLEGREVAF